MSRPRVRPTRQETRSSLLAAAVAVFVEQGIGAASIEEICAAAGLTRGAFYSNFADKNELVMAVIDDHVERDLQEMERLLELADAPADFITLVDSPERRHDGPVGRNVVLYMEFKLYALRNPANRARLAEHQQRWRAVIASVIQADLDRLGVDPPIPVDEAAAMLLALDNGYLLAELLDPASHQPGAFARNVTWLRSLFEASIATESGGRSEA